jgi:hypothetical protein
MECDYSGGRIMSGFEVTLKQLGQHGACVGGYNKLVCALKGVPFNEDKDTYIRYKHDAPIPLAYIAESNGLDDALWCLRWNAHYRLDTRPEGCVMQHYF